MTLRVRTVAAIAIMGLLSLQAGEVCAGWQSAPEARMACCAPEADCPMEQATTSPGHGGHAAVPDADICCAMSEPGSGAREVPAPAVQLAAAALVDGATISAFQPVVASRVPLVPVPPPSGLARHVLLSVFLI